LSIERKIPPPLFAAKRLLVDATKQGTGVGNPESVFVQFAPLSVDKKTPLLVPAKRFEPLEAKTKT
jgi:hypothetical protein